MKTTLIIGLGSALGGMARYGCAVWMEQMFGKSFPWGTLFVNVSGSLIIGFVLTLTEAIGRMPAGHDSDWRAFVMVGICGGYTTFSSFSLQTLVLSRNGQWGLAAVYVAGSVILCLAAVVLGSVCAALLNPRG